MPFDDFTFLLLLPLRSLVISVCSFDKRNFLKLVRRTVAEEFCLEVSTRRFAVLLRRVTEASLLLACFRVDRPLLVLPMNKTVFTPLARLFLAQLTFLRGFGAAEEQ